jgi:hypothetical protein
MTHPNLNAANALARFELAPGSVPVAWNNLPGRLCAAREGANRQVGDADDNGFVGSFDGDSLRLVFRA